MTRFIGLVFSLVLSLISWCVCAEPVTVKVGGYSFPPFVNIPDDPNQNVNGLTIDLIEALNQLQNTYQFVFVSTTPKGRYRHFNNGRIDALFFESKKWGWSDYPVEESDSYLNGGEVYIARKVAGRDQSYFDSIKDKRLMAILGYHYGFANFNSDEIFLRENFNIYLTSSHRNSIRALFSGTGIADIAVVTKSYLHQFLAENPEYKDKILISDRLDQVYNHTILIRKEHALKVSDVNQYLKTLSEQGKLQAIWSKYGIHQP
ncbi:substrate-binding periplasmic protein [Litoribrevibacter albus]|uniref:substrate-binding periplasmic protein n=1 Tax=Litoribrevibacter albus TaxID=1473156 RepID=UPI0024E1241F|nr:transporter substrate-binding domain-containing protein [Litoribrevibacter albus]